MKSAIFSLLALSSAVIVTQTEINTYYVTIDGNGDAVAVAGPAPTTSQQQQQQAPAATTPAASHSHSYQPPNNQYGYIASVPASQEAPKPTTETSSTSSSTSSTTSSTTPAPETTTSASEAPATTSTTSTTPAASTTSASSGLNSFQSDLVDYHNRVRAEHQVGPVTWNNDLANYAQEYLGRSNCVFAHSGGPYGENIAFGFATNDAALDAWYNEENLYDYSAGQFSEATGHFTQMVWKGSTEIGCATIDCSGSTYLACEYTPRGNIIGEFTSNVFPKSS